MARDEAASEAKTSGVAYDRLFMRHWDHWLDQKRSRLFALALDEAGQAAGEPVLVSGAVDADIPGRPFGGVEDYAIGPDGENVYFTARLRNAQEAWSTNFDLWLAPIDGTSGPTNLTLSNPAWDTAPVFSPDGKSFLFVSDRSDDGQRTGCRRRHPRSRRALGGALGRFHRPPPARASGLAGHDSGGDAPSGQPGSFSLSTACPSRRHQQRAGSRPRKHHTVQQEGLRGRRRRPPARRGHSHRSGSSARRTTRRRWCSTG